MRPWRGREGRGVGVGVGRRRQRVDDVDAVLQRVVVGVCAELGPVVEELLGEGRIVDRVTDVQLAVEGVPAEVGRAGPDGHGRPVLEQHDELVVHQVGVDPRLAEPLDLRGVDGLVVLDPGVVGLGVIDDLDVGAGQMGLTKRGEHVGPGELVDRGAQAEGRVARLADEPQQPGQ